MIADDPYELRIAGIEDGGKIWKPVVARLDGEEAPQMESRGLVEVRMHTDTGRAVKSSVQFKAEPASLIVRFCLLLPGFN